MVNGLTQPLQCLFHRVEIRQIFWRWRLFGVLHNAVFIDDERCARRRGAKSAKIIQQHAIIAGGFLVQITRQRDANLLLLRPRFLGKRTVNADADDFGIQIGILFEAGGDIAHFSRANARKRERKEQQHRVLFSKIIAQRHIRDAAARFAFQRKIRRFAADLNGHNSL